MTNDSTVRMNAAKLVALQNQPYLGSVLFAMTPIATDQVKLIATDEKWRVYYNPEAIHRYPIEQVAGLLLHEAGHCLRDHVGRSRTLNIPPSDFPTWNIAGDVLINDGLITDQVQLPENGVFIETLQKRGVECTADMSTEHVYALLVDHANRNRCGCPPLPPSAGQGAGAPQNTPQGTQGNNGASPDAGGGDASGGGHSGSQGSPCPFCGNLNSETPLPEIDDCGSIVDGSPRPYEVGSGAETSSPSNDPGVDPARAYVLRRQAARAIQEHARNKGKVPAGMLRWANELLDPVVNWRRELSATVKHTIALVRGQRTYTYSRPSRRQPAMNRANQNVILPAMRAPEPPPIAVVFDSSGSMDDTMIGWGMSEVKSILRSTASRRNITFVSCDAQAHVNTNVARISDAEIVGGGGTDMRVGIEAAMGVRPQPRIIIVVTDGFTDWPDKPLPGVTMIVCLTDDDQATRVPSWAKVLHITR